MFNRIWYKDFPYLYAHHCDNLYYFVALRNYLLATQGRTETDAIITTFNTLWCKLQADAVNEVHGNGYTKSRLFK